MSDNNQQQLAFFTHYLEDQFCEDLSAEEMKAVQGGLSLTSAGDDIYRRPFHPLPIDPAPKPIDGVIPVHPRPLPRPFPIPHPRPFPGPLRHPFIIRDTIAIDDTKAFTTNDV
jgi:Serine endopeptidase inhibitors